MPKYPEGNSAPQPGWDVELSEVDREYYKDPDHLGDKLRAFAEERGLVAPFRRSAEPGAAPNGDPAERLGNSGAGGGPPSVS
jgi:hypothetical protein